MDLYQLTDTFAVMTAQLAAQPEPADAELYTRLDRNYGDFKGCSLLACHSFDADWGVWERHPAGDEIVLLIDGEVTFVVRDGEANERRITLTDPLSYAIVPKGLWHTACTNVATRVVFLTPGEGTENKSFD